VRSAVKLHHLLLAKSGEPTHSLIGHMLDTAAVALEVLRREPPATLLRLSRSLQLDEYSAARFIAAIVATHDLGKATPAFVARWRPGREKLERAGFRFPLTRPYGDTPHGALTDGLLERWLGRNGMPLRARRALARAVGAHHGFVSEREHVSRSEDPKVTGGKEWEDARDALLDELFQVVGAHLPRDVSDIPPDVTVAIMALASLCDWIASSAEHFPYNRDLSDLKAYFEGACKQAAEALDCIGWHPREPLVRGQEELEDVFRRCFEGKEPNSLQRTVGLALRDLRTPALLLIEAPMGTGKTEAALYAHLYLQRAAGHRGLYMALPTQATGNGMFPRIRKFLEALGGRPLDLQLQHGAALLNREYRALQPVRVGESPDDAVTAHEWFTARKRAILSEYGVGTVDQALLGVLPVRHHFVRLWGLGNRTVVLDEVYAYDVYTSTLIESLVRWLGRLGSSVVLLSATLSRRQRERLIQAYGGNMPDEEPRYPCVVVVPEGGRAHAWSVTVPERRIRLLGLPKGVPEVGARARALAQAGGCVACIVNTVERAQALYRWLTSEGGRPTGEPICEKGIQVGRRVEGVEVYLLHARYPSEERLVREELVQRLFGKEGYENGSRPRKAILIVAQVVEQSLDVDFDAMIADLAPVDLLLRRAGRLHRFDAKRPEAHAEARLWVAGLEDDLPDLEGWESMYSAYVLLRTWWVLRRRPEITVPTEVEHLIERVYGEETLDTPAEVGRRLEEARRQHEEEDKKRLHWARGVAVEEVQDLLGPGADVVSARRLEDDEEQGGQVPLTRYDEPSVSVVPLHRVGEALFLDRDGAERVDLDSEPSDDLAERIFMRSVRLVDWWVVRAFERVRCPQGWRKHPLLRHLRPLELEGGLARIASRLVTLDPELGVVYDGRSCET